MRKIQGLFHSFFHSEKSGGILLIFCTLISILLTNSTLGNAYSEYWNMDIKGHTLTQWINDGIMTVFFLLIGLELEREVYAGELSTWKKASLPAISALGGVLVPALIFFLFNQNTDTTSGTGIPMATDIAFAIGILSLLGDRVPFSLKIFLTALAVIDDLLAIIVIAVFYTEQIHYLSLSAALLCFFILLVCNRKKVENSLIYLVGGILMWFFMFHSGIHPTISGVLLAFALPFGDGSEKNISHRWQSKLHYPVAFFILPLFALANTCVVFNGYWMEDLNSPLSIGIIVGLVAGKPIGITLFALLSIALGICGLPSDLKLKHILGAGFLGGIGFTMSIFITLLAFDSVIWIESAKIAIILASLISGLAGSIFLYFVLDGKR